MLYIISEGDITLINPEGDITLYILKLNLTYIGKIIMKFKDSVDSVHSAINLIKETSPSYKTFGMEAINTTEGFKNLNMKSENIPRYVFSKFEQIYLQRKITLMRIYFRKKHNMPFFGTIPRNLLNRVVESCYGDLNSIEVKDGDISLFTYYQKACTKGSDNNHYMGCELLLSPLMCEYRDSLDIIKDKHLIDEYYEYFKDTALK